MAGKLIRNEGGLYEYEPKMDNFESVELIGYFNEPYGIREDGSCNHAWLWFLNGPPRHDGYAWCMYCKERKE